MSRTDNLNAKEKLKKARIKLSDPEDGSPFFAHITRKLTFKEKEKIPSAGVDYRGNMYFNPEFINSMKLSEITAVLCHEVMHPAFKHRLRKGQRDHGLWNTATDVMINHILNKNGFNLPEEVNVNKDRDKNFPPIYPENGKVSFDDLGVTIEDLDEKNAEEVYDILDEEIPEKKVKIHIKGQGSGDGEGETGQGNNQDGDQEDNQDEENENGGGNEDEESDEDEKDFEDYVGQNGKGFDVHIYEEGEDEDGETGQEIDWDKEIAKAAAKAKERGEMPGGMDRHVNETLQSTVNWKDTLRNYISREIKTDTTYRRPHKNTRTLQNAGVNTYLPDTVKEGLNIALTLDLSGSMGSKEVAHYLGEMKEIANSFENVNMTVIQHDSEVTKVDEYTNVSPQDIEGMELKGGGGTDHTPVFNYIEENNVNADIMVNLTDGHTLVPDHAPRDMDVLWVVDNHRVDEETLKFGRILRADYHGEEA